jgi:glycosyltransferase involved in cell wall biosynthesis
MKILLPFISRSGQPIDSPIITGGIEKVAKNIYEMFPNEIIPVTITGEDRANRKTKQVFLDAVKKHQPDMILVNDIDGCFFEPQISDGIPTVSIIHEPLCGDVRYLNLYKNLHKFTDAGGHLYFVSPNQFEFVQKNILRITGRPLGKTHGFFNSSYCTGEEKVSEKLFYDAVTVGRTDVLKNPFYVHKKLQGTGLDSCVLTTQGNFQKNTEQVKYYESNLHWKSPQHTYRGLPYEETMEKLSQSRCYISPCQSESWGVTAMEALAHGVPLILVTDNSGKHSSESIASDPSQYRTVPKRIKPDELAQVVKELSAYSYEQRLEISRMTKEKHSKDKYKGKLNSMFNARLSP